MAQSSTPSCWTKWQKLENKIKNNRMRGNKNYIKDKIAELDDEMEIVDRKIKSIDTVKDNLESEQLVLQEKFSKLFSDREKLQAELENPGDENLKRKYESSLSDEETPIKEKHARISFVDHPQKRMPLRALNGQTGHTKFKQRSRSREDAKDSREIESIYCDMQGISEMFNDPLEDDPFAISPSAVSTNQAPEIDEESTESRLSQSLQIIL